MLKDDALDFCRTLLDQQPTGATALGGNSRESVRVHFPNSSIIATKRKNSSRADMEAIVLRELNIGGGPVPKILHYDKEWLIQEDLGDIRLSIALSKADQKTGHALLSRCLDGLSDIHRIGKERKLDKMLPIIGQKDGWLENFIQIPERLGNHIEIPAPPLNSEELLEQLKIKAHTFLKWDTRPGNIIISNEGKPKWIDWEHCGVRNPLDDFAWLLADEYVPDWPEIEADLFESIFVNLADGLDQENAYRYLTIFGTFHMCHRFSLVLSKKKNGPWWNIEECLLNDRVGVFQVAATRTRNRAKRWAAENELTAPLCPWLDKISALIV